MYWEQYEKACEVHYINKIKIIYEPNKIKYTYFYNKSEEVLATKLIKLDVDLGIFIEKLILNDVKLNPSDDLKKTSIEFNRCEIVFKKNDDAIDEFVWFMSLVRVEIFDYEEDEYFIDKAINVREKCHEIEKITEKMKTRL